MSHDADSRVRAVLHLYVGPYVDLLVAVGVALACVAGVVWTAGALRVALGLPLACLLPGYAVVSALFPARSRGPSGGVPGFGVRVALAVATSVALSVTIGFGLGVVGLPLSTKWMAGTLGSVAVLGGAFAARRRWALLPERRFALPVAELAASVRRGALERESGVDAALTVALAAAVVLAVSMLAYGLVVPRSPASFSSFSVLPANGSNEPAAGDYSTTLSQGRPAEFLLSVENHERERTEYTVVSQLQRVNAATDAVTRRIELNRTTAVVRDGRTRRVTVTVRPPLSGSQLRLAFYLYTGDAPARADTESALEHLHVWVRVAPT